MWKSYPATHPTPPPPHTQSFHENKSSALETWGVRNDNIVDDIINDQSVLKRKDMLERKRICRSLMVVAFVKCFPSLMWAFEICTHYHPTTSPPPQSVLNTSLYQMCGGQSGNCALEKLCAWNVTHKKTYVQCTQYATCAHDTHVKCAYFGNKKLSTRVSQSFQSGAHGGSYYIPPPPCGDCTKDVTELQYLHTESSHSSLRKLASSLINSGSPLLAPYWNICPLSSVS